jgi:hypothetical protein
LVPGLETSTVHELVRGGDTSQFGVFALGIMPVCSAFILVEVVAAGLDFLLPARRGGRLGTPADRRHLDRVGWALAIGLALLQGFFIVQYLDSMGGPSFAVLAEGRGAGALVMLTLAAGVMVQVIAAEVISRFGLCNGYVALLGAGALAALVRISDMPRMPPGLDRGFVYVTFAVAALVAFAASRVRSVDGDAPGVRLPFTGAVPVSLVRGSLGLFGLAAVWSPWVAEQVYALNRRALVLELGALLPMSLLILWSAKRRWSTPGIVATLAFLAVLVVMPFWVDAALRPMLLVADGALAGLLLAEVITGLRARLALPQPVTVLVVHDVARADEAADRLAAAGIPYALLGGRARAVLRLLGPFVPVELRVPANHAESARAAIAIAE